MVPSLKAAVFWLLAAAVVVPGIFVIVSRDIVRACFWLLGSMSGVAGLYLLLGADFVGLAQLLIYVGGIMILLLFGIMLTSRDPLLIKNVPTIRLVLPASVSGVLLFAILLKVILGSPWRQAADRPPGYTAAEIGRRLMTDYVLPFEIVSILLLVALVGAAYLARRE